MILRIIANMIEKRSGTKLKTATLRLDPETLIIDGVFTREDGTTGKFNPQKSDRALMYVLRGKVTFDTVDVYTAHIDYPGKAFTITVFGTKNGEKVKHIEPNTI
jgi:hypothetical protein